jgi:hypothetical protein
LFSRPLLDIAFQLGMQQDRKFGLQSNCKSQYSVRPISVAIVSPVVFPGDRPSPTKGAWSLRYSLERCGDSKWYNASFAASDSGTPTYGAGFPGATRASPLLIRDAMSVAASAAVVKSARRDCADVALFDMREIPLPGGDGSGGSWQENWTFKICGQTVDVGMVFTPDPITGSTSFRTEVVKMDKSVDSR